MRKICSLFMLLFFWGVNSIFSQTLTVTHTEENNLEAEIQTALAGADVASIKTLKIISQDANLSYNPDLVYIKNTFKTTLEVLDLSEATFVNNKLPNGGGPWGNVGAFTGMTALIETILPDNLEAIGSAAFSGCTNLKTVNLANSIKLIESYAFRYCSKLEMEALPTNLTTMYLNVFENCSKITIPTLPDALQSIGEKAFYNCSAMTASNLPTDLVTVGKQAFDECTNVAFSQWPEGITSVGADAFRKTKVTFTTWPSGLTTITNGVFVNSFSVANFTIPSEVTTIEQRAFYVSPAVDRTFTCKSATPPTAVDVNAGGSLLPTFGPDPAASQITLNVLRKYANAFSAVTPWNKMNIQPITHQVTLQINNNEFGSITSDYEHGMITEGTMVVYEGDEVNFNILPNSGYVISQLLLDGTDIKEALEDSKLTLTTIEKDATIEIFFSSTVNIENSELNAIDVYLNNANVVSIVGADNKTKVLFDINGRKLVDTTDNLIDISVYNNGIYLLKVENKTFKILKK